MIGLTTSIDEVVLVHGECLDLRQPMAYAGVLTITNKRVHFSPSRLNRAIGASEWELPIVRIDEVLLSGLQPVMTIKAGAATLRLMGRDVELLYERLKVLHLSHIGESLKDARFEPGERVLCHLSVAMELNRFMWIKGWVTLTDRRFRFKPSRKFEQLILQTTEIDAPLSIIRAGNLDVLRKRLELRIKHKIVVFRGAPLPRLYAFMNVLARDGGEANLIGVEPASLHRGLLAQHGQLASTNNRLFFVSSGALEAMIGTREELDIQLRDLRRIEIQGSVEPRLVIYTGDARHELTLANPADKLMSLVPALLHVDGWDDPDCSNDECSISLMDAEKLLEVWLPRLGISPSLVLLAGPAVHMSTKPGVRRGWILLTATEVVFLPVGGPGSKERPMVMQSQMLVAPLVEDELGPQLRLMTHGVTIRVLPRGGTAFVERFWELWRDERLKLLEVTRERIRQRREEQKLQRREARTGFNRREVYRVVFPAPIPCIISVTGEYPEEMGQHIEAEAINLSEGGVCVYSPEALKIDQEVVLRFEDETLGGLLPGRVVHYRKLRKKRFRLGIEFIDIEVNLQLTVRNVVMDIQREDLALRAEMRKG
jgi:hypothetical protein